jgi:uncharacterized phage infection (PIP) family protein YhgE
MSQSTLDDDELFGEAANEMRTDVEDSLAQARAQLPAGDDIWDTESDNTLGVLNGLKSALDVEGARDHLRDAKKWYTMGERADAFEDADDLAAELEELTDLLESIADTREDVGDLASSLPELRGTLQDLDTGATDEAEADAEGEAGDEGESEA